MYTFSFGSHDLQISPHQIILISMSLVFYQFELKKKKKKKKCFKISRRLYGRIDIFSCSLHVNAVLI